MDQPLNFNADVGEGIGNEAYLMPYLSSCNIACGGHAGDQEEMEKIAAMAIQHKVAVGAHPSYPDRVNFGRLEHGLSEDQIFSTVKDQVSSLLKAIKPFKGELHHIKPHGALYHRANKDEATAQTLVAVIKDLNLKTAFMGLPDSILEAICKAQNIPYLREAFADRKYDKQGLLVSRKTAGAVLTNKETILAQVQNIFSNNIVVIDDGSTVSIYADSICFHGDTPNAAEILAYCYQNLKK